jgi:hypothetical protein
VICLLRCQKVRIWCLAIMGVVAMRPIALVGGGRRGVLVVYVVPRCKIAETRPRDVHMCSDFLCNYVAYSYFRCAPTHTPSVLLPFIAQAHAHTHTQINAHTQHARTHPHTHPHTHTHARARASIHTPLRACAVERDRCTHPPSDREAVSGALHQLPRPQH